MSTFLSAVGGGHPPARSPPPPRLCRFAHLQITFGDMEIHVIFRGARSLIIMMNAFLVIFAPNNASDTVFSGSK